MIIEIIADGNMCTAYVQLTHAETPGDPEYNAMARHLHCEREDLSYLQERAIQEADDTLSQQEYDDWQAALQDDEVLWRLRVSRHDRE